MGATVAAKRCLICREPIAAEAERYCATRRKDGGLVCPDCLVLVRKGNTVAFDKLANSSAVW